MKASVQFRRADDSSAGGGAPPLVRAKVPISVLGLPFVAGLSAGDPSDLRFDVSTALRAGPSLRLSYHPDRPSSFSLSLKSGSGPLGSPCGAPFSISAHVALLSNRPPAFCLVLRPRFGDFALKTAVNSSGSAGDHDVRASIASSDPSISKSSSSSAVDENCSSLSLLSFENGTETPPVVGVRPPSENRRSKDLVDSAKGGTIAGLVSGTQVSATSVLPLWNRAVLNFKWGLRMPPELRASAGGGGRFLQQQMPGVSLPKLPLLVLSKISVEQLPRYRQEKKVEEIDGRSNKAAAQDSFSMMKHQLESLREESALLRRAVEDLRAGGGGGRSNTGMTSNKDNRGANGRSRTTPTATMKSDDAHSALKKAVEARGVSGNPIN